MKFRNLKIQKIILSLAVASMLLPALVVFSYPKKTEAFGPVFDFLTELFTGQGATLQAVGTSEQTIDTGISIKNVSLEVLRQITMATTRRLLAQMTKSTVNWINTGFHGSPLFLQNPQSFFKDIGKYEVKTLIDQIGYNSLKMPFGRQYALNTIDSYKRQLADNLEYSMSQVVSDPERLNSLRTDFNVGGWEGFLLNTQYPQNNYIGFNMLVNEELSGRLAGTVQNNAQQVQDTLQKGLGFLSPQSCPSNPNYNNLANQFNQPSFNADKEIPYNPTPPGPDDYVCSGEGEEDSCTYTPEYQKYLYDYETDRNEQIAIKWDDWRKTNECPGGLVATTPGSVVGAQINRAMGSTFSQTELGAALGNSMSAVFDALINRFMDQGLNSLASTMNPPPPLDDWSYLGNTLGGPGDGTGNDVFGGPDEIVELGKFKQDVQDGIDNTTEELKLMDNESATSPGISQLISSTWPKTRELDMCLPGPDIGWEDRLLKEMDRNSQKLQEEGTDNDPEKAAAAQLTYKSLQYAVSSFRDWINTSMMRALPDGIVFMEAVKDDSIYQESTELTNNKRRKDQALARLMAIQSGLASFATQPAAGSQAEKNLIALKKQYDATRSAISNTASIEDTKNELSIAKERLSNLGKLVADCNTERVAAGWTFPPGRGSRYFPSGGGGLTPDVPHQAMGFLDTGVPPGPNNCSYVGGWAWDPDFPDVPTSVHIYFDGTNPVTPVAGAFRQDLKDAGIGNGNHGFTVPIPRSLWDGKKHTINAYAIDLNGNGNPNLHYSPEVINCGPDGTPAPVTSTSLEDIFPNDLVSSVNNTEQQLFCDWPITNGYSHESFLNRAPSGKVYYPKIPMVNAEEVLVYGGWPGLKWTSGFLPGFPGGDKKLDIELNCNIIYRSYIFDYKQDLPGPTNVIELPPDGVHDDTGGGSEEGVPPPDDADTKHRNHEAEVEQAKESMIADGYTFKSGVADCQADTPMVNNRLEVLKRAARLIGNDNGAAGLLSKPTGNNCSGYASDIIAFPDGYIYDVLTGANDPTWLPSACGPNPGPGTCSDRYSPVP